MPEEIFSITGMGVSFNINTRADMPAGIPMRLTDYLELVDATGRIMRDDKRGYIPSASTKILDRLGLNEDQWLTMTQQFEQCFSTFAGQEQHLRNACEKLDYQRPPGLSRCKAAFG